MLEFTFPAGLLDGHPPYWYAVVRKSEFPRQDYDGYPRAAPPGADTRILVLEPGADADAFLSRYDSSLRYIQDTWYPTREAAVQDVDAEFGSQLTTWMPVPEDEPDAETFVLRAVGSGH
jgi:hypothetical protein